MKQPILRKGKRDEADEAEAEAEAEAETEADLEYGTQRKAIMDIKAEVASVHFMVTNLFSAAVGWATGAILFAVYLFLVYHL
jgi:hypothetical protein